MAIRVREKFKVVSDGTGAGTKLLDSAGNEVLAGNIRSIKWEISAARIARVTLELLPVELEAEGVLAEVGADVEQVS